MHRQYNTDFPDDFPRTLSDAAHSLLDLRIEAYVWKYEDVKKVINFLIDEQYIILGGDVYTKVAGNLTLTYDNWYLKDPDPRPLHEHIKADKERVLEMSREQSLSYVENYWKRNGDNYYYSVVFDRVDSDSKKRQGL